MTPLFATLLWLTALCEPVSSVPCNINNCITASGNQHVCAIHSAEKDVSATAFGQSMGKYIKQIRNLPDNYKLKTVVIDAGHGGYDTGARGGRTYEKHITLKMALQLGRAIQAVYPGVKVVYTRTTDVAVPLFQRAKLANEQKADLFLSIHCNYFQNRRVQGTETYVMGLHTANYNLQVAKRENASILMEDNYEQNYDGYDPNSPEGHIILSMYQNAFLEQSIAFADKVEKQFQRKADRKSRGVKQAGFVVLKGTTMPSVLIELGFISNYNEEQYLTSSYGQQQLAASITQAFVDYKNEVEGNVDNGKIVVPVPAIKKSRPLIGENTNSSSSSQPVTEEPTSQVEKKPSLKSLEELTAQDIQFKVLLIQSQRLLQDTDYDWDTLPYLIEINKHGGDYRYYAAGFSSYEAASQAKNKLREQLFPQAFVVATVQGKRISMKEALRICQEP